VNQIHHVAGMHNLRDLGGFVTATGAITRSDVFWRGDAPHRINPTEIDYFLAHQITTVIDLRHNHEQLLAPNPFAQHTDVQYIAVPLFQVSQQTSSAMTSLDEFYIHLLERSQEPIKQAIMHLADAPQGAFFHCRVGKDRTGIIAALLLDLVGVPHADIIADYVATADHITPLLPELRRDRPAHIDEATYEQIIAVEASSMAKLLQHIQGNYGSTMNYFTHIGLPATQINRIEQKFI